MTEQEAFIILNAISGLGNSRIKKLLNHFHSASRVLMCSAAELTHCRILPAEVIKNIHEFPKDSFLKKEYNLLISEKVQVVVFLEENYPQRLKEIPDAPVVLYVKGDLKELGKPAIAMVGSRKASLYGISLAQKFASELAQLGIQIVSGLARGIDTAAHRGALKVKGQTSAVLACGLNSVYPAENARLAKEMVECGGCIVSEFCMEMPAIDYHFPRRNRIVSGLSLGVVVVEASDKSGALITADCALEQGREVFAVPGPVGHPNSQGVHRLIKEGAKLIGSVEDILVELQAPLSAYSNKNCSPNKTLSTPLSGLENQIYAMLSSDPTHIDQLVTNCGQSAAVTSGVLLQLELKKAVKQFPGKMFARVI